MKRFRPQASSLFKPFGENNPVLQPSAPGLPLPCASSLRWIAFALSRVHVRATQHV